MVLVIDRVESSFDPYKVLGVASSAKEADIKKAYYRLALSQHPDKVAPSKRAEAERRFKQINLAWELLRKDRAKVDEMLAAGEDPSAPEGSSPSTARGSNKKKANSAMLRVPVNIPLEAVLRGGSTTVPVSVPISRYSAVVYLLPVTVKPGCRDGDIAARRHAPGLGEVVAIISVRPHRVFTRRGDDLYASIKLNRFYPKLKPKKLHFRPLGAPPFPLPCAMAAIPIDGPLRDGMRLRGIGLGLPKANSKDQRGDLVLTVHFRTNKGSMIQLAFKASPFLLTALAIVSRKWLFPALGNAIHHQQQRTPRTTRSNTSDQHHNGMVSRLIRILVAGGAAILSDILSLQSAPPSFMNKQGDHSSPFRTAFRSSFARTQDTFEASPLDQQPQTTKNWFTSSFLNRRHFDRRYEEAQTTTHPEQTPSEAAVLEATNTLSGPDTLLSSLRHGFLQTLVSSIALLL